MWNTTSIIPSFETTAYNETALATDHLCVCMQVCCKLMVGARTVEMHNFIISHLTYQNLKILYKYWTMRKEDMIRCSFN